MSTGSLSFPFVVIGNYLLDSLPIDIYRYAPTERIPHDDAAVTDFVDDSAKRTGRGAGTPAQSASLQRLCVALPSSSDALGDAPRSWKQWTKEAKFEWSTSTMEQLVDTCTPRSSCLAEGEIDKSGHHAAVMNTFASPQARALCKDGMHAPFIVPVGAARLVRDIARLRDPKSSYPHLCIFGDKTFGSKESSCISLGPTPAQQDKKAGISCSDGRGGGKAPPIIVHHTSDPGNNGAGCVSVSVDLGLISQLVEQNGPRCSLCKTVYIADRMNGSGGQFDVTMCCNSCVCRQKTRVGRESIHGLSSGDENICNVGEYCSVLSPTDIEAVAEVAYASSDYWTASELLALIEASEFDPGLFSSICWPLSHKLRNTIPQNDVVSPLEIPQAQTTVNVHARAKAAALRCLENSYFEVVAPAGSVQHEQNEFEFAMRTARFLYTIGFFDESVQVLRGCASATGRREAEHLCSKAEAFGTLGLGYK